VFLRVQTLKEEAELASWQLKREEPGEHGQKGRKTYGKQDEIIKKRSKNTIN
jgi:hypothetical protein